MMSKQSKLKSRQKNKRAFSSTFWQMFKSHWIFLILTPVFLFSLFIIYSIVTNDHKIIPLSFLAVVLGLVYESYRITHSIEKIKLYAAIAYFISLFAFLPYKNEINYSFDQHLQYWVFGYLICYLLIFITQNRKQTTAFIDYGVSLLFLSSFIYWLFVRNLIHLDHLFTQFLSILLLAYSIFILFHALRSRQFNDLSRFLMSLVTCIIVLILSIDNLVQLFRQGDLSLERAYTDNVLLFSQYFFLGISSLYLFQNLMLLFEFFPNKYGGSYFSNLKVTYRDHIERMSIQPVSIKKTLFYLTMTVSIYSSNFYYDLLPSNMMIWAVIIVLPVLIDLILPPKMDHSTIQMGKIKNTSNHRKIQKRKIKKN